MKRIHFYVFLILTSILLSACKHKAKVGVLFDFGMDGRWKVDKELLSANLEARGMQVLFYAAEGNSDLQYPHAEEMLKEGAELLIVSPTDLNTSANIVALAHSYGVKVIAYDRMIKNSDLDFYISFDNVQVGELQAKYMLKQCPRGKYAIFGGAKSDNNSFLIRSGQYKILQPYIDSGRVRVVFDQYTYNWNSEEGYRLMKECLSKQVDVCAVMAASDGLAEGAVRALEEAAITPFPMLCGQDAQLAACRRVLLGRQSMTVYKPVKELARVVAEAALLVVEENRFPAANTRVYNGMQSVPTILLNSYILDVGNLENVLVQDGFYTREELHATE